MNGISKLLLFFLFLWFCLRTHAQPAHSYTYGDSIQIVGVIERRPYVMPLGDTLYASMLVLEENFLICSSGSGGPYSYGSLTLTHEFHIDAFKPQGVNYEQVRAYYGKKVKIQGRLVPAENRHHLGAVCIAVKKITPHNSFKK